MQVFSRPSYGTITNQAPTEHRFVPQLPIEIRSQNKPHPGYFILLVGVFVPLVLGAVMVFGGRCKESEKYFGCLSQYLCEEPPFGAKTQRVISAVAGTGLLFEALSNFCKYIINYYIYRTSLRQQGADDVELAAPLLIPPSLTDTESSKYSSFQLHWKILSPYLVAIVENIVFTFSSILPLAERYATSLRSMQEKSHVLHKNLTACRLQSINELLNKLFIAILFVNAFVQTSGLKYYTKLITVIILVTYFYFREFLSLQSGRLIRQQMVMREKLSNVNSILRSIPRVIYSSDEIARLDLLIADVQQVTGTHMKSNSFFLIFNQVHDIISRLKQEVLRISRSDLEDDRKTHIIERCKHFLGIENTDLSPQTNKQDSYRFFRITLPKPKYTVTHSNGFGIALVIINLFLPNLVQIRYHTTAKIISSIILSIAIFMPLNGLTDWENNLWGFHEQIRGNGYRNGYMISFLAFFVVNLPKLQGFSGSVEGVGISIGDTKITLICEVINMFFGLIRSAITLPYAFKEAINPSPIGDESPITSLMKIM